MALIAASALAPGCVYYGATSRDVDRTPIVDTGVGASVIMPGQTAPAFPGSTGGAQPGAKRVDGLGPVLGSGKVAGFHLFTFNDVADTAAWRQERLSRS